MKLDRLLFKSIAESVFGRYMVYVVQVISMMIMARLFTPEQFGVYTGIQVFAIFFSLISEMGIAPALINQKNISRNMRDGIFSLTIIVGTSLGLVFFLLGPVISIFYDNAVYKILVVPVAISVIFNSAMIVPIASIQKEHRFILISGCSMLAELCSLFSIILFVNQLQPVLVLALKPLISSAVVCIMLWVFSGNTKTGRPMLGRELSQIKPLLSFIKSQFSFNFINYFSRNLDTILVGKYFGATSLGIYDKAYQLMRYPLMLLTFAMNPAIQPVLTKVRNEPIEFERLHNRFIKYMGFIGITIGVLCYFFADYIVVLVLGEQWLSVVSILKILSLTIPTQIIMSSTGGFYQAAGRADLLLICGLFSAVTNIAGMIIGIALGDLEYLSWALVVTFSINCIQNYYLMARYLLPNGAFNLIKVLFFPIVTNYLFIIYVAIVGFKN